jgi:hypothetical protein
MNDCVPLWPLLVGLALAIVCVGGLILLAKYNPED